MRIPSIPTPTDVAGLVGSGIEQFEALAGAVPRMLALLDDAEALVARTEALVDRMEKTHRKADGVVRRTEAVAKRSEALIDDIEPTTARITALTASLDPSLATLSPVLDRLAETTDPDEVEAMVRMIDLLPSIATKMEQDILPILDTMNTVAPDLRDLLDVSKELNEMLAHLPGMRKVKDKVEEDQAAEDAARNGAV